jgi:hypothetical protein
MKRNEVVLPAARDACEHLGDEVAVRVDEQQPPARCDVLSAHPREERRLAHAGLSDHEDVAEPIEPREIES